MRDVGGLKRPRREYIHCPTGTPHGANRNSCPSRAVIRTSVVVLAVNDVPGRVTLLAARRDAISYVRSMSRAVLVAAVAVALGGCAHAPLQSPAAGGQPWLELTSEHLVMRTDYPESSAREALATFDK